MENQIKNKVVPVFEIRKVQMKPLSISTTGGREGEGDGEEERERERVALPLRERNTSHISDMVTSFL